MKINKVFAAGITIATLSCIGSGVAFELGYKAVSASLAIVAFLVLILSPLVEEGV